jgi:hypothetical protein
MQNRIFKEQSLKVKYEKHTMQCHTDKSTKPFIRNMNHSTRNFALQPCESTPSEDLNNAISSIVIGAHDKANNISERCQSTQAYSF